ncbi:MAG: ATPase [Lachnospiraceae bacterium]|nr:ATPase [Lachnospiraceae bacterium]
MKTITIEELEQIHDKNCCVIDIRPAEQYSRGTFPGAVNIPADQLEELLEEDDDERLEKLLEEGTLKRRTIYVLCHTGERSRSSVELLEEAGYDAVNIEGGYRAYLKLSLSRYMEQESKEKRQEKQAEIERSIIKKFRKTIWRPFTKGLHEYQLIQEGDKIAVCISGGKDSMLLAKLIQELQKHGKIPFEAVFLVMNPGYNADNWKIIQDNAKLLGIPLTVFESNIFDTVAGIERNPCYLCARMRRGYLYSRAKELGCNKIALGHHFDDVIETILMGMLYSGKVETMMPKLHSQNFEGMELIRPLYLVKEDAIKSWRDYNGLHFIQCACRFTANCVSCGGGRGSKRDEMKELIAQFRKTSDVIDTNIFNSVKNINLRTVIGYHKDDMSYCFLDDYATVQSQADLHKNCDEWLHS